MAQRKNTPAPTTAVEYSNAVLTRLMAAMPKFLKCPDFARFKAACTQQQLEEIEFKFAALFMAKSWANTGQLLSMPNFLTDEPGRTDVLTRDCMDRQLETALACAADGHSWPALYKDAVACAMNYRCYEQWEYVFEFFKDFADDDQPLFENMVKFLYDGFSD